MTFNRSPLTARAERQHGLVSRTDLADLRISRTRRRRLVTGGSLEVLGPQVFRIPGAPATDLQRVLAACLDSGGVASHTTAAWLHDLSGFSPGSPPHTIRLGTAIRYRGAVARPHVTTHLEADEVLTVEGVPCLSVARTLLTLAGMPGEGSRARFEPAAEEALRRDLATERWLWWMLERLRCRGRAGVIALEDLLTVRADGKRTESWLEREFLSIIDAAGLRAPTCQQTIAPDGAFVARVDFVHEPERVVIEVLGHAWHSSRDQLARDAKRRNELQLAGYQVLEFPYDDVVRRPDAVVATVRAALGRAVTVA